MQDAICRRADITVDITGPTTPCDALSFGMGFDAKPARFGNVFVTEGDQSVCPPKTDPANVVCDEL